MGSTKEINKKAKQIQETTAYLAQLASELRALTDVSTSVLKRSPSKAKLEMRAIVAAKLKNHFKEKPSKQ